jgi:hypothetical protein
MCNQQTDCNANTVRHPTCACSGRRFASSEIGVIFQAGICYNDFAMYWWLRR